MNGKRPSQSSSSLSSSSTAKIVEKIEPQNKIFNKWIGNSRQRQTTDLIANLQSMFGAGCRRPNKNIRYYDNVGCWMLASTSFTNWCLSSHQMSPKHLCGSMQKHLSTNDDVTFIRVLVRRIHHLIWQFIFSIFSATSTNVAPSAKNSKLLFYGTAEHPNDEHKNPKSERNREKVENETAKANEWKGQSIPFAPLANPFIRLVDCATHNITPPFEFHSDHPFHDAVRLFTGKI